MSVGGTTLLATAHDPHERVRVQATNDFIVFGTVACTAFASGAIEATGGWAALNLMVVPPTGDRGCAGDLALVGSARGWRRRRLKRPAMGAPPDGAVGLFGPIALNWPNCCRNDASVPGDGVVRATTDTGTSLPWSSRLDVLQHALIVEGQYHHLLAQYPLHPPDARPGYLADIQPGIVVKGRPRRRRSDQRRDVRPRRRARHQLLELVGIHAVAAKLRLRLEEAAAAKHKAGQQHKGGQQGG